jgi:RNase P/RNase MRP subunit POP5
VSITSKIEIIKLSIIIMSKIQFRRIAECFLRALPGQLKGIVSEFKQLRKDRVQLRSHKSAARRLTSVWRIIFPLYQLGDDILEFIIFAVLLAKFGSVISATITVGFTFALAVAIALVERQVQQFHAAALNVREEVYGGRVLPDMVDSLTNSAPWAVLRHANEPRVTGGAIKILSIKRVLLLSTCYAVFNTILYLFADALPVVNSWTGFLILLAITMTIKGFIEEWTKTSKQV